MVSGLEQPSPWPASRGCPSSPGHFYSGRQGEGERRLEPWWASGRTKRCNGRGETQGWRLAADLSVLRTEGPPPLKKRDLSPGDPYYDAWQEYRRISRRSLVRVLLFFYGGFGLTVALVEMIFPTAPQWVGLVAGAPWLVPTILTSQGPIRWLCPRCGHAFLSGRWGHNAFARRCLHCGLPKWAPRDVAA